ncbi:MAG: 30S ribosomal protein S20 [Patescibacteria group bacterium]|nr:30S ribosomal protein S20 [Patescibacteria group bacterium]
MPIKHAAKKALRKSKRQQKINLVWKDKIKKITKKVQELIKNNKKEEAKKELATAYKIFDKACKAGKIKKNTASRKKSRLTNLLNKSGKETKEVKKETKKVVKK